MSNVTLSLFRSTEERMYGSEKNKILELLGDPDAVFIGPEPALEEVQDLLPVLNARLKISILRGTHIFGLVPVVRRLQELPKDVKILGYGIKSPTSLGNIYVDERDQKVLGAAIVGRARK